jgi:hypothetical protein
MTFWTSAGMQAGQVKMARDPVDIREILVQCQEIFALRLEKRKSP